MENTALPLEGDAMLSAISRKITSPAPQQTGNQRPEGGSTPTRTEMGGAISSRIRALKNAERIYDALPEMETIVTISVSQLLSTKDLVTTVLNYEVLDSDVPIGLRETVARRIREIFNEERNLPKRLYKWLYRAHRSKGASPVMVLSDVGFDELFSLGNTQNVAQEFVANKRKDYFTRQLGILRAKGKEKLSARESIFSTPQVPTAPQTIEVDLSGLTGLFGEPENGEKIEDVFKIEITDNPNCVRFSEAYRRVAAESAKKAQAIQYGLTYEEPTPVLQGDEFEKGKQTAGNAFADLTDINPRYNEPTEFKQYLSVGKNTIDQKNVLDASDHEIPPECLFPVSLPGEEDKPLGWVAFQDDLGNYITGKSNMYQDANIVNYLNGEGVTDSNITRASLGLNTDFTLRPDLAQRFYNRFGELVMDQFTKDLSEMMGGAELTIAMTDELGKALSIRHMAKRHTTALYIPADNLCYFATDLNEDGIGVSIAERSFIISTVRMALLFATMNSSILNSARHMQYDIQLSPDARNGQESVDRIKSDIINGQNRMLPQWGNVLDVWSMATNAGLAFNVEGNDYYSSHKVSVSDTTPDYKVPDPAIDEDLLRKTCRIANVDPDLVLTPENIEFASQIFSKSLIVTQQTVKKQEMLEPVLTKYVRNHMMASPSVRNVIIELILEHLGSNGEENIDPVKRDAEVSSLYRAIVNSTICRIPPPDTSTAASQMDQYDKRVEFIDKIIDDNWDKGMGQALGGMDVGLDSDTTKNIIRQFYVNGWMERNGIETDLIDLLTNPDNRLDNVIEITDRFQNIARFVAMVAKRSNSKFNSTMKDLGANPDDADSDPWAKSNDDASSDIDTDDTDTDPDSEFSDNPDDDSDSDTDDSSDVSDLDSADGNPDDGDEQNDNPDDII